jgi:hypothetical protein
MQLLIRTKEEMSGSACKKIKLEPKDLELLKKSFVILRDNLCVPLW